MTEQTRAQLKTDIDTVYVNNITQDTENSDFNNTLNNLVDSALMLTIGESAQEAKSEVDFTGGIKKNGLDLVGLCNSVAIRSEQDWIDSTVESEPGVRQVLVNTVYVICGTVTRSFRLLTNGFTTIKGDNPNIDIDNYTGTGASWSDTAAFSGLTIIRCSSKGVAGTGSSFIDQSNAALILSIDIAFIEYDDMGTTDAIINVHDKVAFGSAAIPILTGLFMNSVNSPTIRFSACAFRLDSVAVVTGVDISTATSINSILITIAFTGGEATGSIGIKGAPNSANLLATARGLIIECNFRTVDIPLDGITVNDLKWGLVGNRGIQNTMPDSHSTCMDRVTSTVIVSQDTPVEIGGGSASANPLDDWLDISSSRFTVDPETGRTTYIGLDPLRTPVSFGNTVDPDSGTNKNIYIYMGFGASGDANPTAIQDSRSEINVDSGDPQPISTFTQITFETGDYISPMIAIKTGTTVVDVLCTNNKVRVN